MKLIRRIKVKLQKLHFTSSYSMLSAWPHCKSFWRAPGL